MINIVLILSLSSYYVNASPDWEKITNEIYDCPEAYDLKKIEGGATNSNYHLTIDGCDYFVRFASPAAQMLNSSIETEYQVLQELSCLNISCKPIYYNQDKRMLVLEFLKKDVAEVDLLDPSIRLEIITLMHQIEKCDIKIDRVYQPFQQTFEFISKINSLDKDSLPPAFMEDCLCALKGIEKMLANIQKNQLCHLDLHHGNIIKSQGRLWIIDWEYASLGDPFVSLASMASIERWDDQQMLILLRDYKADFEDEDFYRLYLYRIVADIYWTAWCHLQTLISTIDMPYCEWEKLYLDAALQRIRSPLFFEKQGRDALM